MLWTFSLAVAWYRYVGIGICLLQLTTGHAAKSGLGNQAAWQRRIKTSPEAKRFNLLRPSFRNRRWGRYVRYVSDRYRRTSVPWGERHKACLVVARSIRSTADTTSNSTRCG